MEKMIYNNLLNNIKCKYIFKQIFEKLKQKILLDIIKYNTNIQKILDINLNNYKTYKKIEIEIIPIINKKEENKFINIKDEFKSYYHIYFNDDKNEINRDYYTKNDGIKKIKIIIDEEIKSFEGLFDGCNCIEKINFIKFNRIDINNMSFMFFSCKSLKQINLNNFNTNNVKDMKYSN